MSKRYLAWQPPSPGPSPVRRRSRLARLSHGSDAAHLVARRRPAIRYRPVAGRATRSRVALLPSVAYAGTIWRPLRRLRRRRSTGHRLVASARHDSGRSHGWTRSIVFSGTAAQVESAFHTQIHTYKIGNEVHHANASDPAIPMAFAQVVGGVVSLHDFRSATMHTGARLPAPDFTSGGSYYFAPADFATIYDVAPLYQQSINGSGQSVAIVPARTLASPTSDSSAPFSACPPTIPRSLSTEPTPAFSALAKRAKPISMWSGRARCKKCSGQVCGLEIHERERWQLSFRK